MAMLKILSHCKNIAIFVSAASRLSVCVNLLICIKPALSGARRKREKNRAEYILRKVCNSVFFFSVFDVGVKYTSFYFAFQMMR